MINEKLQAAFNYQINKELYSEYLSQFYFFLTKFQGQFQKMKFSILMSAKKKIVEKKGH